MHVHVVVHVHAMYMCMGGISVVYNIPVVYVMKSLPQLRLPSVLYDGCTSID